MMQGDFHPALAHGTACIRASTHKRRVQAHNHWPRARKRRAQAECGFCGMNEENGKNPRPVRKLWIGIGILVLLSPLGIIIPRYFGAKGAWGEWGLDQIEKLAGFVPEGMKRIAHIWQAPMTDYTVPGQGTGFGGGLGYLLAGILGVGATAGLMYLVTKMLMRRNGSSERKR